MVAPTYNIQSVGAVIDRPQTITNNLNKGQAL